METLAQWVSALAAIGALMTAAWAARTAKRVYLIEAERDVAAAENRQRAAASRVSAWIASHYTHPHAPERVDRGRRDGLMVVNVGRTPVYGLRIESTDKDGHPRPPMVQGILPPGEYFVAATDAEWDWDFPDDVRYLGGLVRPITKRPTWLVTQMTFTDPDGRSWRRDARGRLHAEGLTDALTAPAEEPAVGIDDMPPDQPVG